MTAHPAKFSKPIMERLAVIVEGRRCVLDPFAGTGRVHELGVPSWGVEIEPEWASLHARTLVGNALELPFRDGSFDAVVTSPTYGNRMADHHVAKDSSKRNTYRHTLGRALHPANSGQLQWGPKYEGFHLAAWAEVDRVLAPGGVFVLNVSDHIRKGKIAEVSLFHVWAMCTKYGYRPPDEERIFTQRQRQGANGAARVPYESIFVFTKE